MTPPKIYDISVPVSDDLLVWPGDPKVRVTRVSDLASGDVSTVSHLAMTTHSGTHIDTPSHFLPGEASLDEVALEVLVGTAVVVDTGPAETLTAEVLESLAIPAGAGRILFRTGNEAHWPEQAKAFREDFIGITEDGARWLADRGVKLVGVDYLSVAAFDDLVSAHKILLAAGMILLESITLAGVPAGDYELICLPLKIAGAEGAPCRAILRQQNHG